MFCSQCGNAINLNDKFCGKCGVAALKPSANATRAAIITPQLPNFGRIKEEWRGMMGELPSIKPYSEPYGWLSQQENTFLVFDNHLALMRGGKESSRFTDAMTSGAFGLAGGLVGLSIVVGKGIVSNKSNSSDPERQNDLFNAGNFVWCKKEEAEIWKVERKKELFIKPPSLYALSCTFNSLVGKLYFLFPFAVQEGFKSPIDNFGCQIIIKAKGLNYEEAYIAFGNFFKDLPRI